MSYRNHRGAPCPYCARLTYPDFDDSIWWDIDNSFEAICYYCDKPFRVEVSTTIEWVTEEIEAPDPEEKTMDTDEQYWRQT